MTATPRYDLYGPVHKALRAQLCDALLRVGRLDLADAGELRRTCDLVSALAATLRSHLAHEDHFIHPLMHMLACDSAAAAEHEHADHLKAIGQVERLSATLAATPDEATSSKLYHALALLVADNLVHMEREESQHHELLWACRSDAELAALEQRIVGACSPDEIASLMGWMIPALTPAQRAGMLGQMRAEAPPPVFEGTLAIARSNLDSTAWSKLARALGLDPVPGLVAA